MTKRLWAGFQTTVKRTQQNVSTCHFWYEKITLQQLHRVPITKTFSLKWYLAKARAEPLRLSKSNHILTKTPSCSEHVSFSLISCWILGRGGTQGVLQGSSPPVLKCRLLGDSAGEEPLLFAAVLPGRSEIGIHAPPEPASLCPNHLLYTPPVVMGIPGTSDSRMTWVMD